MSNFQFRADQLVDEMVQFNQNLSKGVKNLLEADEISAGVTPREEIYAEDKLTLYRYQPSTGVVQNRIPTLIVYALVNRPYMMDIQENRSTIRGLLDSGQDVYLIDWGYPDRADKYLTLDDYINGYIDRCVDVMRERHGVDKINILGICQGGVFSLCYSTLHPDKVKNLVTMVTPVDCKTPGNMLSHWVQKMDIDAIVDAMGNLPGEMLNWTFLNLKPFQLMGQKYVSMVDIIVPPVHQRFFPAKQAGRRRAQDWQARGRSRRPPCSHSQHLRRAGSPRATGSFKGNAQACR
jgi:polyhydroxyalkanoate synthase